MKGLQGERTEQSRVVPPGNENAKERKNNAQSKREWKMSGVRVTKGKKREKGAGWNMAKRGRKSKDPYCFYLGVQGPPLQL